MFCFKVPLASCNPSESWREFFFEKIESLGIVPGNNSLIGIHFPFWFKFWGSWQINKVNSLEHWSKSQKSFFTIKRWHIYVSGWAPKWVLQHSMGSIFVTRNSSNNSSSTSSSSISSPSRYEIFMKWVSFKMSSWVSHGKQLCNNK